MELREFFAVVRRRWRLILVPALIVGAAAVVTYRPPSAAFTTSIRFTAAQPALTLTPDSASNYDPNYYRWLTSEYIVNGLADWVRAGAFAQAVSAELAAQGATIPAAAIQGALAADNARSVLVVYLTWGDADQLAQIAQAVSTVLQRDNAAAFPQLGGQPAVVTPMDSPVVTLAAPGLRQRLDLPVRLLIALAAGLALGLLVEYLDPTIRDRRELAALGIEVVGEIPRE